MRVTFLKFQPHVASSRYRAAIPERELYLRGYEKGNDVLVASKHSWKWDEITQGFKRVVYDVCDDHFHDKHEAHYRECCEKAWRITCNSRVMAEVVKKETGRDAVVIPDPYEQLECEPRLHNHLLWYGHAANLHGLVDLAPRITKYKLTVVSNYKDFIPWTPENMDEAFRKAGLVIIPKTKSDAKSANRAIEAIRRGLYVLADPMPAYADLGIWQGDIPEGIKWALEHRDEALKRVAHMQTYVREEYSPRRIGELWIKALGTS